jgi:hypothetical protein
LTTCAHASAANESARLASLAAAWCCATRPARSRRNGDTTLGTPVSNVPARLSVGARLVCLAWWDNGGALQPSGPENFIGGPAGT